MLGSVNKRERGGLGPWEGRGGERGKARGGRVEERETDWKDHLASAAARTALI